MMIPRLCHKIHRNIAAPFLCMCEKGRSVLIQWEAKGFLFPRELRERFSTSSHSPTARWFRWLLLRWIYWTWSFCSESGLESPALSPPLAPALQRYCCTRSSPPCRTNRICSPLSGLRSLREARPKGPRSFIALGKPWSLSSRFAHGETWSPHTILSIGVLECIGFYWQLTVSLLAQDSPRFASGDLNFIVAS